MVRGTLPTPSTSELLDNMQTPLLSASASLSPSPLSWLDSMSDAVDEHDPEQPLLVDAMSTERILEAPPLSPILPPPYARFRLASRFIPPPTVPRLLAEHPHPIQAEEQGWLDFWNQLKPLVVKLEQFDRRVLGVTLTLGLLGGMLAALSGRLIYARMGSGGSGTTTSLLFGVTLTLLLVALPILGLERMFHKMRQVVLGPIQEYCRDGDEVATLFQQSGYSLECELLPSDVHGSRLHLYVLPVDKPYVRLEVYNGSHGCFSTYQTCLASGDVRPHDLQALLPLDEWQAFWSEMRKLYEPQTEFCDATLRQCVMVQCVMVALVVALILAHAFFDAASSGFSAFLATTLDLGLISSLAVTTIYAFYRCNAFQAAKVRLVWGYALQWHPRGVYMEHRKLMCFHPVMGLFERHYLYLFHIAAANAAAVPVATETGDNVSASMDSTITNADGSLA